ncbi:hypothetical protein BGW36DRAFT_462412 [Talaromyces proteolyticus]|uniref:Uncharacterized protein n=1 Tax=Talaromyces proteolyticus TaxID=1131652 RepID=A0AAD4Q062_9EURO|nr:uncharacterized protein BGW36DRAFT_462412 [Talaromyces proteolyticus]KAH8696578.1 hypothetical protein BGW36DRAFT_462412 [Talaromyces proteolyticus]
MAQEQDPQVEHAKTSTCFSELRITVSYRTRPGSSFNISLAVNKIRHGDGNDLLHNLKKGFDEIFLTIARAFDGQHGTSDVEGKIFTAIVSLCSSRILGRLRLVRHAWKAPKKSIKEILQNVIECVRQSGHGRIERVNVISIATTAVTKILPRLENLVEGIYQLQQMGTVHNVLELIPNKDIAPSLRESLLNMIGKVARYRQAARFLFRAAKKFSIVRQARVIPVNLPPEAFRPIGLGEYVPQNLPTISSAAPKYAKITNLNQIWRLLQTSDSEASDQFSNQTQKIFREAKVHAEIQLVFHCELHLVANKFPRVIRSTKDACHLCSTFISTHGKMHTLRCHGRLYPGWRLPIFGQLNSVQQEFIHILETQNRRSLDTFLLRRERTVYPCPNESTLLTLPTSMSTLMTFPHPELDSLGIELTRQGSPAGDTSSPVSKTFFAGDISESDFLTLKGSLLSSDPSDSYSPPQGIPLTKTIEASCKLSPLYAAGPLEVQIEYCKGSGQMPANDLPYSLEWLTAEDAEMERCHSRCVVDAESLDGESLHPICSDNSLYLVARGPVLRLKLTRRYVN